MNYPEFVKIGDKKYKINTDFRVAIECEKIANDDEIDDYERALAIIYKLFGDEGLKDFNNHPKLLELARKYLSCGSEKEKNDNEEADMDLEQDLELIRISFMSDYNGLDIKDREMHFWEFMNRIDGLSNSEMGNCCVLNRVRNLRNYDTKDIKDQKELDKINKAKESVKLKKKIKINSLTKEQQQNIDNFYKMTGMQRKV